MENQELLVKSSEDNLKEWVPPMVSQVQLSEVTQGGYVGSGEDNVMYS